LVVLAIPESPVQQLAEDPTMAKVQEKLFSAAVKERRATSSFEDVPIPGADLEKIVRAGLEAPSGYNLQPWRFVVVRDREPRTYGGRFDPARTVFGEEWGKKIEF
jgi:nitroreductase